MSVYDDLIAFQRETEALAQVMGRLGWDQETVMPSGAANQRAEEMAALEKVLHARRTDPRIGDWLEGAMPGNEVERANIRLIARSFKRNTRVPAELAGEIARATSLGQHVWAEARANEDVGAFREVLADIVRLRREEASALADDGDRYDALLNDYEPGSSGAELQAMFDQMRPRLVELRERLLGSDHSVAALAHRFDESGQLALSRELAETFGYNFSRGRIDKAVHPFSSGSGLDVRITTRTAADDPFNCIYSTIHEVGHAAYEQGIDLAYLLTPIGEGVSMGVHESQSRIYENQLGRSRAFTAHLFDRMRARFGDFGIASPEEFYATANRVSSGYIRTEADEVHYNLHIMMRFDLERQLIGGTLEAGDLEDAWNARFEQDFGVAVDKPSNGCLQDVHWSAGLFGYFPTYTLGNVYAGCLYQSLRQDIPDLDEQLRAGDLATATGWLRDRLQRHGGLREPAETIRTACGFEPDIEPLMTYLEAKFSEIYRL